MQLTDELQIVGAASAMIDGVISVAIEADHVAICKFGSREDTGYVTIRGWILDIRENGEPIAQPIPPTNQEIRARRVELFAQTNASTS